MFPYMWRWYELCLWIHIVSKWHSTGSSIRTPVSFRHLSPKRCILRLTHHLLPLRLSDLLIQLWSEVIWCFRQVLNLDLLVLYLLLKLILPSPLIFRLFVLVFLMPVVPLLGAHLAWVELLVWSGSSCVCVCVGGESVSVHRVIATRI